MDLMPWVPDRRQIDCKENKEAPERIIPGQYTCVPRSTFSVGRMAKFLSRGKVGRGQTGQGGRKDLK